MHNAACGCSNALIRFGTNDFSHEKSLKSNKIIIFCQNLYYNSHVFIIFMRHGSDKFEYKIIIWYIFYGFYRANIISSFSAVRRRHRFGKLCLFSL